MPGETSQNQEVMQSAIGLETTQIYREDFELERQMPPQLAELKDISRNFYWSWRPEGVALFNDIDPEQWDRSEQNPRHFLRKVNMLRLWQKAGDLSYLQRLERFTEDFDEYTSVGAKAFGKVTPSNPVAYFCAEYGVHNSLPIYSGGLGILAGDHLKSASDLNVPLVAVGLLYRFGYFRQSIAHNGWQEERYVDGFGPDSEMALEPVREPDGTFMTVNVHIRGRVVVCRAWLARIGRISLYLLDTNMPQNSEVDRLITGHLYGGDSETRIVQEKVLGIGGVRLLRKLEITPSVFHLNEGHSAFLTLELAREYLDAHPQAAFTDAMAEVRRLCVFTTHTPVAAGNDEFEPKLLRSCFSDSFIGSLKLTDSEFLALGRTDPDSNDEYFGMTPLALRMSRSANGVSEKHGEVSRELWVRMYADDTPATEVPITHITNGVHPPTWIARVFQELYAAKIGQDWAEITHDPVLWDMSLGKLSNDDIWSAHQTLKNLLIAFVRRRTRVSDTGSVDTINEHRHTSQLLSPEILTIGFARRVATYKRWDLILSDLQRLLRLVDDPERPVQFVFAGKAHPQDRSAKKILADLMQINHESNWQNRAVFIEDYDQEVARYLVHGVDVWMNVPRRPHEASGTSGMKAAMNGALNFSILDGWWIEGYNEKNGFAIGGLEEEESEAIDAADAAALYETLENQVIPLYYDREDGVPNRWIAAMRNSIATLTPQFSSDRMVADYLQKIYERD